MQKGWLMWYILWLTGIHVYIMLIRIRMLHNTIISYSEYTQSKVLSAQIWPRSHIRPTYRVGWWHRWGPLLFARSGPHVSHSNTVCQPKVQKVAWISFLLFGPHSPVTNGPNGFVVLGYCGIFRSHLLLQGQKQCITARSGPNHMLCRFDLDKKILCSWQCLIQMIVSIWLIWWIH